MLLRRAQTWRLHTKLYKFGWHTSANNSGMKSSKDLILGEVVCISTIYRISDSWLKFIEWLRFLIFITWLVKTENRPSPSSLVPRFQNESTASKTCHMINEFDWHGNETACRTHFHMKGFALKLVLKQIQGKERTWLVCEQTGSTITHIIKSMFEWPIYFYQHKSTSRWKLYLTALYRHF